MKFNETHVHDLNIIADWLSVDDLATQGGIQPELMVIAGHAIMPNILGALSLAANRNIPVLLSGGIGHSTTLLEQAVKNNAITASLGDNLEGFSEAEILASIATHIFAIPSARLYIEKKSTNCGSNASQSLELIQDKSLKVKSIILVQDPLMQRRTYESFKYHWTNKNVQCEFINWPVFHPHLLLINEQPSIIGGDVSGIWDLTRYVSMIVGEIKRLQDNENGYGPRGRGFIGHVDVPEEVMGAWRRLILNPEIDRIIR